MKISRWKLWIFQKIRIFLQKNWSLKKLTFEILNISINNIINVELTKVLEYVCSEELGEILNPLALRLGPIFWIANSSSWWHRLYDAHWFWVQEKASFRPICEAVLRLGSRPISSFKVFKKNIKTIIFFNCSLEVVSFECARMIKCVESCFQDSSISSHVLLHIFYCCIRWFIIKLDLGFQPRLTSLSHLAHEYWTNCNSNSKWRNWQQTNR